MPTSSVCSQYAAGSDCSGLGQREVTHLPFPRDARLRKHEARRVYVRGRRSGLRQPRREERNIRMRWLRRWRERDDRHLIKATAPSPLPEIDPIEELARIVGEAQERDAEEERRFEDFGPWWAAEAAAAPKARVEGQVAPKPREDLKSGKIRRISCVAGRWIGEVEPGAFVEKLTDVDRDRIRLDEGDRIGGVFVAANDAVVLGRKRGRKLTNQGSLRRERNSAPRPVRQSMHMPTENVPDRDVFASRDEIRERPRLEESDAVEDGNPKGNRGMMHGEKRRPALKLSQGRFKPVEASGA